MKITLLLLLVCPLMAAADGDYIDLAPFAKLMTWPAEGPGRFFDGQNVKADNVGLQWDEERDVRDIHVQYDTAAQRGARVEYWFKNWPYPPPKMPTIEDPLDDPWQGKWLPARAIERCDSLECVYTFQPLTADENPFAKNLPGVDYRRTLKVRLVFGGPAPPVKAIRAYSESREKPVRVRIELGSRDRGDWSGAIDVFNGTLRSARGWNLQAGDTVAASGIWRLRRNGAPKGLLLDLAASQPAPPGSNDVTIVTFRVAGEYEHRTFSFSVDDLARGPVRVPDFDAAVFLESGALNATPRRDRIRAMIPREPEQSLERATREIPRLDPWQREWGGSVYLPLAADSSWQKFAFDYSGNIFASKKDTKAKGRELARLRWKDDKLLWKIGTGNDPYFREDHKTTISVLEGYLPVVTERWERDGLRYSEEAFATVLRGPLSPDDPARSEQTPAVLMLRVTVENGSGAAQTASVWLKTDPDEQLSIAGQSVQAAEGVRAAISPPHAEKVRLEKGAAHTSFSVPADGRSSVVLRLPFVSDLSAEDVSALEQLEYETQRERVVEYWRGLAAQSARITVPEQKFNDLIKAVIPHIHISTTKDPASGLYMVPAASYVYQVFANEASFQSLYLDTMGYSNTSAEYFETLLRLQGSRNFPGVHEGSYDAVFHGAKVSDEYDYTASGYGHGTVLWALAEHYFFTRDKKWLANAWPRMSKAIDWIIKQRSTTQHLERGQKAPDYGLLPASQLEDNPDWANWFAINGYAWAGMDRTAQVLADAGYPDAARVRREADAYRTDIRTAVLHASQLSPVVRMRDGTYEPYVPVLPFRRLRLFGPIRMDYYSRYRMPDTKPLLRLGADRETLYGPMILLSLGLFSPNEPLAGWVLDDWEDNQTLSSGMGMNIHGMTDDNYWFSQGGMVFQANLQNPITTYLHRHEIPAAIRSLYNDFVACLYPDVNVFTVEYHQWRHGSGPFYKIPDEARFTNRLRDMLVFEEGDSLYLAPGTPRRWLESREGIAVDRVVTYFGPISYSMHAGESPGTVEATVHLPNRNPAKTAWLVARTPAGRIDSVTIDGQPWQKIDGTLEAVELPARTEPMHVTIQYRSR
jgi:hypothetical protein